MKSILTLLAGLLLSFNLYAQKQIHTEFNSGGDIRMEENTDNLPEFLFDSSLGNVGQLGISPSSNQNAPNDENIFIRNNKQFGKIRLEVSSGLITVNPNTIGNGAYIGINANSPIAPLTANIINGGAAADFRSTNTGKAYIQFSVNDGSSIAEKGFLGVIDVNNPHDISLGTTMSNTTGKLMLGTQNQDWLTINSAGNTFVGDYSNFPASAINSPGQLNVCGNVIASGSLIANAFTCNSDLRFKTAIVPIENALSNITALNGVQYLWDTATFPNNGFTDSPQIGLIAQEVETVFPQLVATDEAGYKSIDYVSLTAVLIEALKEQQLKITQLEAQMNEMKDIKKRLQLLEENR